MAGFFRQMLSIAPATGVCSRLEFAFSKEIIKPNADCYIALVAAWEEAIRPYEKQEPAIFQMHKTHRLCDEICKVFALNSVPKSAAHCAGEILASLCYTPYAQSPGPRNTWYVLMATLDGISKNLEANNRRFRELNPRSSARFSELGREPFVREEGPRISDFVMNWANANGVKWK